jgi:hypothetical protein
MTSLLKGELSSYLVKDELAPLREWIKIGLR